MNVRTGQQGEIYAAQYLISLGYHLLEKNFRSRWGEVDLIAKKDNTVVFVEVKMRRNGLFGLPEEYITAQKKERIRRTIFTYFMKKDKPAVLQWQFDVIGIIRNSFDEVINIRHYKNQPLT